MSETNNTIDYRGFKGAGGPNAPPPQKPGSNPTLARILLLILAPILVAILLFIFSSPFNQAGTFIPHIIGALCAGIIIAINDWVIEEYAYTKGLWFCYGGYYKIGKLDSKHVPIDMIIGFIGTGFCVVFLTYFPELFRYLGWNFWPISDPNLDSWMVPGLLIIIALYSAFGDFQTKKFGLWMNGPTWSYWKCAFCAWLPLMTSGVIVDRLIMLTWTNIALLIMTITIIFSTLIIIMIIFCKKVL